MVRDHPLVFALLIIGIIVVSGCVNGKDQDPRLDSFSVSTDSPTVGAPFQIVVAASDDNGLTSLSIDVGDFQDMFLCNGQKTCSTTWSVSLGEAGSQQITITAVDTGNQRTTRSTSITVDGEDDGPRCGNGICEAGEASTCPADCENGMSDLLGDPDAPFITTQIELVDTRVSDGYTVEFYRNNAYTCGWKGYHTFVIVYQKGIPLTEPHPLWIRLHGGGGGAFAPDGTYEPPFFHPDGEDRASSSLDEEDWKELFNFLDQSGLIANVKADESGFRFLIPSLCDHDFYSGVGLVDLHNPYNPGENGDVRKNDGLLALLAAFEYTRDRVKTTHIFAHGTSAGSIGTATLLHRLAREGEHLSGAILDSGIFHPWFAPVVQTGCTGLYEDVQPVLNKVGVYAQVDYQIHTGIANGVIDTPLYQIWSRDDPSPCGEEVLTVTSDDGVTVTGTGAWVMHHLLAEAIDQYNPGGASKWREVCVDDPSSKQSTCDRHSSTQHAASLAGGDLDRNGEDYNRVIMDWVEERLKDPLP